MKIDDGTGKGFQAKVDASNRLFTKAITESEALQAGDVGDSYNISTGLISITGDATLLYFKNNEEADFVFEAVAIGAFEGITHSDDPYFTLIKNPLAGDLISDATTTGVISQNRNFGSTKSLTADIYKGKVGGTITGGEDTAILHVNPATRSFYSINFILPKGSSVAIDLTANVSSGSANYYCAIIGYLKSSDD